MKPLRVIAMSDLLHANDAYKTLPKRNPATLIVSSIRENIEARFLFRFALRADGTTLRDMRLRYD
jgi:hypothetical protein